MPFKSKQQAKWAHTEAGEKALGGPQKVAEWDRATKESGGFKRLKETLKKKK